MTQALIHQIFYSAQTRAELDPGFIAHDNLANARPDWREYWPIREFLQHTELDDEKLYGFFSPKFAAKTGLTSSVVHDFIARQSSETEVVLFSPFFDQSAFYQNVFEQGMTHELGFLDMSRAAIELMLPGVAPESLVMTSRNTVFCNYFVAKPPFWREWQRCAEIVFSAAEQNDSQLGRQLNAEMRHDNAYAPAKVFLIERIASLLLAVQPHWKVGVFDPLNFKLDPMFVRFRNELICLDALKIAFVERGSPPEYWEVYRALRQNIATASKADYDQKLAARAKAAAAPAAKK